MSEQDQTQTTEETTQTTTATEPDVDAEASALAVDDGKGNKMVPLSALISAKKELRTLNKKVKDLEPVAQRVTEINERLDRSEPYINAILSNPKLKAEAIRIAQGTHATAENRPQPEAGDDPDAEGYAEDMAFYLADGATLDVARARRVLNRLDQRHGRQTDDRLRPFASLTLNQKADANLREVEGMTDDQGVPLATPESIREVAKQLPAHLLANPQVIDLVLNSAIGLDRRNRRTPRAAEEPLYMDSAGSGRGRREPVISADERARLQRLGLDEKDYLRTSQALESGVANRRGIVLGR